MEPFHRVFILFRNIIGILPGMTSTVVDGLFQVVQLFHSGKVLEVGFITWPRNQDWKGLMVIPHCSFIYSPIHPSIHPFTHPSIHPSIHSPAHPSII
jgi:hypothetical protein